MKLLKGRFLLFVKKKKKKASLFIHLRVNDSELTLFGEMGGMIYQIKELVSPRSILTPAREGGRCEPGQKME